MSLCENNCYYKGYDSDIKHSECVCDVKNEMETISEIIDIPDKLVQFSTEETSSGSSNMISLECSNVLFTAKGLKKNISSYILLIIVFYYLLSMIAFIKCGFPSFKVELNKILYSKEKSVNIVKNRQITNGKIFGYNNKFLKFKNFKKYAPPKKSEVRFLTNNFPKKRYQTLSKGCNIPTKRICVSDLKDGDKENQSKTKLNSNLLNNKLQIKKEIIPKKNFNENELNSLTYAIQFYMILERFSNIIYIY